MYAHIRVITKHKKYHPPAIREVKLYQHVKDRANRTQSQARLSYAEVQPIFETKPQ